jgi:hypothetical protein
VRSIVIPLAKSHVQAATTPPERTTRRISATPLAGWLIQGTTS